MIGLPYPVHMFNFFIATNLKKNHPNLKQNILGYKVYINYVYSGPGPFLHVTEIED